MNLSRCEKGHFFDHDKYSVCPHCNEEVLKNENSPVPQIPLIKPPSVNSVPRISPVDQNLPLFDNNYMRFIEDVEEVKQGAVELSTCLYEVELFRSSGQIRRKGVFKPTEKCTKVILLDLPVTLREDSIHLQSEMGLVSRKMSIFCYHDNHKTEIEKLQKESEKRLADARPLFDKLQMCELKMKNLRRYIKTQSKSASGYQDYWGNIQEAEKEWNILEEQRIDLQNKAKEILDKNQEIQNQILLLEKEIKGVRGLKFEFVAEPGKEYSFYLDYVVDHVGWSPRYDIRTYTRGTEIQLILQADIYQDSAEDWNNVCLKLTTEDDLPTSDAATIMPQKISLKAKMNDLLTSDPMPTLALGSDLNVTTSEDTLDIALPHIESEEDITVEQDKPIENQYTIDDVVSMKNNTTCTLVLATQKLKIRKLFFSVPKKECSQYLGMFAEEFRNRKLLDCPARIYVDDTYSTKLQTKTLYENGIVVLGRAHGVTIQRRIRKNEENSKKVSEQREVLRAYEIEVENEMDETAEILITDQIPVSHHSAVTVSNVNVGDGVIDDEGICRWDITLNPHEKVVLPIEYVITYPQKEELVWN